MKYISYMDIKPKIDNTNFIADGAKIIGDVRLGKNVNIWFNCVVRADVNFIEIGENVNVQDLSMLHVTEVAPVLIKKNVSIGHSVIIHGATIEEGCLIGMGAKILDGAVIGRNSLVAAGSIVPPGKIYPEGSYIIGSPAKVKRKLTQAEIEKYSNHYCSYLDYANVYLEQEKHHSKD